MRCTIRSGLAVCVLTPSLLIAQSATPQDIPKPHVPLHPPTSQELDHVEALKLYGLACCQEQDNQLVEAIRTLEKALRLDPQATPSHRALIPLYLALDRVDDALAGCKAVLDAEPDDYETGYLYARNLRALDHMQEARNVLARIAAVPGLKEHPELHVQIAFDLGVAYENSSEWAKAEAAFRQVVAIFDQPFALGDNRSVSQEEIDSQCAETLERLGRVCLRGGHPDRAIDAYHAAQKKDPSREARLAYNLAEVYRDQGRPREALQSINSYLRTLPQGTEGYDLKIKLLQQLNRAADVVPELEAARGRDPFNRALKLLLAREYRHFHQPDEAERIYQKLFNETPSPEAYQGLCDIYKEEGLRGGDRALRQLDTTVTAALDKDGKPSDSGAAANARAMLQVLRNDPELVRLLLRSGHDALRGHQTLSQQTCTLLASLAARARQLDAAEELYRSCLARTVVPRHLEQELYDGLLHILLTAHKYEEVLALCKQGLEKARATPRILFHIEAAHANAALNHLKEALAAADLAVNESNDNNRLLCRRVRVGIMAQAERYDDAVAECQALMKEYNQAAEVHEIRSILSSVYTMARQLAKAEEQLKLMLETDPNDATANNDLGYIWADQNKNLDEAERMIRKALELDRQQRSSGAPKGIDTDQDNGAYVDSLGWVLFRKGDLSGARRELEKAIKLPSGTEDPVVFDHLGDVCFRQNDRASAARHWKKAFELYNGGFRPKTDDRYKEIEQKLKRLD